MTQDSVNVPSRAPRFVLLGARRVPRRRAPVLQWLWVWLPVVAMVSLIARESTAAFGGIHTSPVLRPVWEVLFGRVTDEAWEAIHHLLRKTGHFVGYGTLGLTWLRAFLLTWLLPFRLRPAAVWRRWSFAMAIICTAVIASMDEVHQTYLPDRTGRIQDVGIDTVGALVLCGLVSLFWLRRSAQSTTVSEGVSTKQ